MGSDGADSPRIVNYMNRDSISLRNEYGKVLPFQMMIFATSGHGKGLAVEHIIEKWKQATDGIVIYLADPKDEAEASFVMYEPKEKYHLDRISQDGARPKTYKCKMYHPFTFSVPKGHLPKINLFTLPLKNLSREEWSILAETSYDSESIRLMLRVAEGLTRNDGLFNFLHEIQRMVEGRKNKKKLNVDPKNFFLSVGSGTAKSITEIAGLLHPFRNHYFLRKESCQYKLNWKEILTDSESYHVFLSMWLKDQKLKEFMVLSLLKQLIENRHYAKRPILVVIPEMRVLTPRNAQGYKYFLALAIMEAMSTMRSQGRGISSLSDSQNWSDTDDRVKGSATVTYFGQLSTKDQEVVGKAMNYKRDIREQLQNMRKNAYLMFGKEEFGQMRFFFPRHMHKEPHYNWIEMYRKHNLETINYDEQKSIMRKELKEEEKTVKEIIDKKIKKMEEEEKAKEKAKEENSGTEKTEDSGTEKEIDKKQETIMKLAWEMKNDNTLDKKEKTLRAIGKKLNITHHTVKKYIQKYTDLLEKRKEMNYEEKVLEELED